MPPEFAMRLVVVLDEHGIAALLIQTLISTRRVLKDASRGARPAARIKCRGSSHAFPELNRR